MEKEIEHSRIGWLINRKILRDQKRKSNQQMYKSLPGNPTNDKSNIAPQKVIISQLLN